MDSQQLREAYQQALENGDQEEAWLLGNLLNNSLARNPDDNLQKLEAIAATTPSWENLARLNQARLRAGLPLKTRVFEFGEGWQAQTVLPSGRTISSATQAHDGWWGVGHLTWLPSQEDPGTELGEHYVRSHFNDAYPHLEARSKPSAEEVENYHLQVVKRILEQGEQSISRYLNYRWTVESPPRQNPLEITPYMKEWRKSEKVTCVVKMPAKAFLMLTTTETEHYDQHLQEIVNEARSLEDYNRWAKEKSMKPLFLDLTIINPTLAKVDGHEGRHRVVAHLKSGEQTVEVSLRLIGNHGFSRKLTILDLPRYWRSQFDRDYSFDSKNIEAVLEANVQIDSQTKPAIKNISMSGADLAELRNWKD